MKKYSEMTLDEKKALLLILQSIINLWKELQSSINRLVKLVGLDVTDFEEMFDYFRNDVPESRQLHLGDVEDFIDEFTTDF